MTDAARMEGPPSEERAEEEGKDRRPGSGFSSRYLSFLLKLKGKPMKIMIPSEVNEGPLDVITEIPKISDPGVDEVEISKIVDPYSFVRIRYDNVGGEYLYEVIEPNLSGDERNLLELLKNALIMTLNLAEIESAAEKDNILNKATDSLMKTFGVTLHPMSKDRIMYFLRRDFIGYGAIDVMMTDPNVEDCSCDGVDIPLYIYHRKYGSIRSNIRFEKEIELDAFVVWLAQKCGKHISVADPLLDATIPDGSRLNATLGKYVTKRGSSFTIRRFKENPFTPIDLLKFRTMSTDMMAYLWIATEY
ncbi:MAG: type II/IV secretion system ATPase subunit, partial [Methanomassiliicoccales archaeon]|nr:type II/IV secretion system ATPase subunit [Methanomassiliicoccales archaeon]